MKTNLRIFVILFIAIFLSGIYIIGSAHASEANPCKTFYGGGESKNNESCTDTTVGKPTPTPIRTQPQTKAQPQIKPTQLDMVKESPPMEKTPPTGPESLGIGLLTASGILGYFLRKKS